MLLLFKGEDLALSPDRGTVFQLGHDFHVIVGDREHPAGDSQNLVHPLHRILKAGADSVQSGKKEVAEALASQTAVMEAIVEQIGHDRLHIGKGLNTVSQISRRGHTQILAQKARASAVVGHGDDSSNIPAKMLQAPKHGRQSGAAANGSNPWSAVAGDLPSTQIHIISAPDSYPGAVPRQCSQVFPRAGQWHGPWLLTDAVRRYSPYK